MLKNYFIVALRNVLRNRVYTLLNVLGLALGLACGLIIFWFIRFQTTHDNFHVNKDHIYQINTTHASDGINLNRGVPPPMSGAIQKEMPELKTSMCVEQNGRLLAIIDKSGKPIKKFKDDKIVGSYVEPSYFQIFTFPWKVGDTASLAKPNKIALSEALATKFFGNKDPIGKIIRLENALNLEIIGVFYNIPENSELKHDYYISFQTLKSNPKYDYGGPNIASWGGTNSSTYCYTLFPKNVELKTMKKRIKSFNEKYHPKSYKVFYHDFVAFRDLHFIEQYENKVIPPYILWVMTSIGIFLIVTACFNFINMATAQAMRRAKEVGVRKSVGSSNLQIFNQFITETAIIVFASLLIGFGLAASSLPYLNYWIGIDMWQTAIFWNDSVMWLTLFGLFVGVVLLGGTYPALILSGFKPIVALKGSVSTRQVGGISLRRALITFQFVLIQLLLICVLIANQQMAYMLNTPLGYDKQGILEFNIPTADSINQETFKHKMLNIKGVDKISLNSFSPTSNSRNTSNVTYNKRTEPEKWDVSTKNADENYISTYQIKLVAGVNIPKSDTTVGFLVNEKFVERLGIANVNDIVNKNIEIWGMKYKVYGVMKNWFSQSLRDTLMPIAVFSFKSNYQNASIKLNTKNIGKTIKDIEAVWTNYFPNYVFEKRFVDETIKEIYAMEEAMQKLTITFSFIAIFIGCLGMYGLIRFLATQKTKEIGVRKAYGATVFQILYLFGFEMLRLIGISFVIACPIGYYLMNEWLKTYAHRIELDFTVMLIALGITLFIAMVTIGYESYKAANKNPSLALKSE